VYLIDRSSFDKSLKEAKKRYQLELGLLDQQMAADSKVLETAAASLAKDTNHDLRANTFEVLKTARTALEDSRRRKSEILSSIADEIVMECTALAVSKTDADGNFRLNIDDEKENCYVVATVRRKILGWDEAFTWVVGEWRTTERLLLSNDNLFRLDGSLN
jgi:hypothetical protein